MRKAARDYRILTPDKYEAVYIPSWQPFSPGSGSNKGGERAPRQSAQRQRVVTVFVLCVLLTGVAWVTVPARIFLRSPYTCPSPSSPRDADALISPRHRSSPVLLPAAHPDFSLSLTYDTAVCNSFDIVISRLDKDRCAKVEASSPPPSNNSAFLEYARTRLGPDSFHLQVDGAERLAEEVPSEYLGKCEYLFRFRLNNAGRVWVNASLLYENYEAVRERVVEPGAWPKDQPLLLRPLVPAPIELDLCSSACPLFVPSHLGDKSLAVVSPAHGTPAPVALPSCGDAARAGKLRGGYFPLGMFDLLYPDYRQPVGWSSTRLSAGHTRWVPYGCEWRHDGRRFADPASCVDKPHRALFIGDSHARAVFDLVSHRLSGNKTIVQKTVKSAHKNATHGNVHLDFTFLPHLNKTFTCEAHGSYDSVTVSTGTWQAAVDCATTDKVLAELERLFTTWPRLAHECRRPIPNRNIAVLDSSRSRTTRFTYLNMPAFHPQLQRHDGRTGARLSFWNERFGALARKNGWDVVDVYSLTKPVAIDMTLGDGVHYVGTDAAEPAADDVIDRLGLCGETGSKG
ncbi:uncharacterized protein RHOBADRAFT_55014 [Rhodotorula graminis WP1]|uniref:Uncharacterized protein n=1 Tax=Rhodotorula graminis (strain WP1) TaxID=578459 RepID=A0A0P9H0A1_RHOGW|nr:uncharacterized protein RHOBADRAFT_55014 [Rhodotorula graminis WP1]KPV73242.1 hypothetical protein RHOBADRAFT_55014 [Rhodotorula graminis WP1]